MIIQIDSREKARAIKEIVEEFDRQGITHPVSKLWVGDYMNYDNPRLIIDRKQSLQELCCNVTGDHERFQRELRRAQENGIQLVFCVSMGKEYLSYRMLSGGKIQGAGYEEKILIRADGRK